MSRELSSWAQPRRGKPKPRLTWPADLARILRGLGRRGTPAGAPPRERVRRELTVRAELPREHVGLWLLKRRFDIELVGADALTGLAQPLVFAANEQGALDYQLLRSSLPARLRPTVASPSRALTRGRNVVIFGEEPPPTRMVGSFNTVPADLANQHNVALVPVAMVGTFNLKDILKLPLRTKPKISIRFGAPIYVRERTLAQATAELQARVEQLAHEGELTWWTVERRRTSRPEPAPTEPDARWRRLWQQSAPAASPRRRIWG